MPNHFHLLVQQERDGGIIEYMSKVQNSLTRYINIKRKTKGHVFIGQYKAVRIPSDELLLHVSRYIHLNPYTGYVVKTLLETSQYPWSSYGEYISNTEGICQQTKILSHFKTKNSYCEFIENQKDYQRTLAELKGYTHSENI
jgi:putative transposase